MTSPKFKTVKRTVWVTDASMLPWTRVLFSRKDGIQGEKLFRATLTYRVPVKKGKVRR